MLKSELTHQVSREMDVAFPIADDLVNAFCDILTASLLADERIELRGFGVFTTRIYKPQARRNPRDGTSVQVKAKKRAFWKTGFELSKMVDAKTRTSSTRE